MSTEITLDDYLQELADIHGRGDAREETYYPALGRLLKAYADATGRKDADVTIQPGETEAGNPDLRL